MNTWIIGELAVVQVNKMLISKAQIPIKCNRDSRFKNTDEIVSRAPDISMYQVIVIEQRYSTIVIQNKGALKFPFQTVAEIIITKLRSIGAGVRTVPGKRDDGKMDIGVKKVSLG